MAAGLAAQEHVAAIGQRAEDLLRRRFRENSPREEPRPWNPTQSSHPCQTYSSEGGSKSKAVVDTGGTNSFSFVTDRQALRTIRRKCYRRPGSRAWCSLAVAISSQTSVTPSWSSGWWDRSHGFIGQWTVGGPVGYTEFTLMSRPITCWPARKFIVQSTINEMRPGPPSSEDIGNGGLRTRVCSKPGSRTRSDQDAWHNRPENQFNLLAVQSVAL